MKRHASQNTANSGGCAVVAGARLRRRSLDQYAGHLGAVCDAHKVTNAEGTQNDDRRKHGDDPQPGDGFDELTDAHCALPHSSPRKDAGLLLLADDSPFVQICDGPFQLAIAAGGLVFL